MLYLSPDPSKLYFLDIEADSLTPTVIWCCVIKNKQSQQVWRFVNDGSATIYHELKKFIEQRLLDDAYFCGHNLISFDAPCLARLADAVIPLDRQFDTLVLSYLYNPALEGGHSLESYGGRLKFLKGSFSDWSKFSPEMLIYCERDVDLTELVFEALSLKMLAIGFSEQSCYIEHYTRELVDRQQAHGFWFDVERGKDLFNLLRLREQNLTIDIHKLFPPKLVEMGTYTRRLRKDGSDFASFTKHLERYPEVKFNDDGSYTCFDWVDFNIGSYTQRLDRLLELGYTTTEKTKGGSPKVDEESLLRFTEVCREPAVRAMAEWLVCNGRANMVNTWLTHVQTDSRIHGKVMTCGATTRRFTHSSPNSANIPSAAKAQYGHECRALWGVEPNKGLKLVGADASGLENVGMLHYLNNKKAQEILTKPKPDDVHSMNARALTKALGREIDREWGAKTSYFAWLFGAYPPKLGSIVKGPPSDGEIVIKTFFKNVPGLQKLIDNVQSEWYNNKGLLKTVDGGFVRCHSVGAALNYKIQSLGAVVMKLAALRLYQNSTKAGVWYQTTASVHDEWQMEVPEKDAEELGKLAVASIEQAAQELNFIVKLTGDFKIGDNWSMTH